MKKTVLLIISIMLVIAIAFPAAALTTIAVKSIKLNNTKITLEVGETYNLKVTFTPANTSQTLLTYATSNKKIVTVDKNGIIVAVGAGNAVITVISSSNKKITAKSNITVTQGINTSKSVKISGFLLGAPPKGMGDVLAQLNVKLKKDINANLKLNYIGFGDWTSKYPLILAAGEDIDWIFTASWSFYAQEAGKGAFKALDANTLKKYMPRHYAITPSDAWNQTLVKGKMYMIPSSTPDRIIQIAIIREDLRKKYNVPVINKFSEIDPYLKAIKENEPGMIPFNCDSNMDPLYFYVGLSNQNFYNDILGESGTSGIAYNNDDPTGKLVKLTGSEFQPSFKKIATKMKSWYDSGYINKDIFASKVISSDNFTQGKSGVSLTNLTAGKNIIAKAEANGWETSVIPFIPENGNTYAASFIGNGVAIAAKSKNVERTMMALDLIMEDADYDNLVYYGVKGVNYIVKNGMYALPDGLAADKNTYVPDAAGFWFTNKDTMLQMSGVNSQIINYFKYTKDHLKPWYLGAFASDTVNIKTEVANLSQVRAQYYLPLAIGMVKDVDAAIKTLDEQYAAAGQDKVMKELQKQVDAYLAEHK